MQQLKHIIFQNLLNEPRSIFNLEYSSRLLTWSIVQDHDKVLIV